MPTSVSLKGVPSQRKPGAGERNPFGLVFTQGAEDDLPLHHAHSQNTQQASVITVFHSFCMFALAVRAVLKEN